MGYQADEKSVNLGNTWRWNAQDAPLWDWEGVTDGSRGFGAVCFPFVHSDGKAGGEKLNVLLGCGKALPLGCPLYSPVEWRRWAGEGQALHTCCSGGISAADTLFLVSSWVVLTMRGQKRV